MRFIAIVFLFSLVIGCVDSKQKELLLKGDEAFRVGNYAESSIIYEKYLENSKESDDVWKKLGISYYNINKYENAYKCFVIAIEINPSDSDNYANIGLVLERYGRRREAIDYFQISCEMNNYEACQISIKAITAYANQDYLSPGEILLKRALRKPSMSDFFNE